jgi:hypothetical protein
MLSPSGLLIRPMLSDLNSLLERIVYISSDLDYVYVINLKADVFPIMRLMEDVSEALRVEDARVVNYLGLSGK